jgi:hypothetical protein
MELEGNAILVRKPKLILKRFGANRPRKFVKPIFTEEINTMPLAQPLREIQDRRFRTKWRFKQTK